MAKKSAKFGGPISRVIVGTGRNRHVFDVPCRKTDRIGFEKFVEDVKNFLFRPALLNRSN